MAKWTKTLLNWVKKETDIDIININTKPILRYGYDLRLYVRIIGGPIQWFWDIFRVIMIIIIRNNIDVIHLSSSAGIACLRDYAIINIGKIFRIHTIYHLHMGRIPSIIKTNKWEWRILYLSMNSAFRIIVLDNNSYKHLSDIIRKEKIYIIPNPIDKNTICNNNNYLNAAEKIILYIGWILPKKGINELVGAWKSISMLEWKLKIVGPGMKKYIKQIKSIISKMDNIQLLDEISNKKAIELIDKAEIIVLPTYTEGFPYIVLEGMAAGKAIVATPVGAIPEMLDYEKPKPCGIKVNIRNEEALSKALKLIISDEELRKEIGLRAKRKVEMKYNANIVIPNVIKIWMMSTK